MSRLLLHADDFGMNDAVTLGILEGFARGVLTSTSILVNSPAADRAIKEWRRLEQLRSSGNLPSSTVRRRLGDPDAPFDLGVHLNLTQGQPLTHERFPADLLDREGQFLSPGRLFSKLLVEGCRWQTAVREELTAQIGWLVARGLQPTHLNGHQYVETMPVVRDLLPSLAEQFRVTWVRAACEPGHCRNSLRPGMRVANCAMSMIKHRWALALRRKLDAAGIDHPDAYFGASHAGRIDLALVHRFVRLARKYQVSEIAFHPGQAATERVTSTDGWHDPLAAMRPRELQLLCSTELVDLLAASKIELTRFSGTAVRRSQAA